MYISIHKNGKVNVENGKTLIEAGKLFYRLYDDLIRLDSLMVIWEDGCFHKPAIRHIDSEYNSIEVTGDEYKLIFLLLELCCEEAFIIIDGIHSFEASLGRLPDLYQMERLIRVCSE